MATVTAPRPDSALAPRSRLGRLANFFYVRPRLALAALLGPPLVWLAVVYLGSLAGLVLQSLYHLDSFSGKVIRQLTLATYADLLSETENYRIVARTAGMATAVTLAAALVAFPLAYYMARYASPRRKGLLYLAVLLPLWSNYLVRVYAWEIILAKEGILGWFIHALGLDFALNALLQTPVWEVRVTTAEKVVAAGVQRLAKMGGSAAALVVEASVLVEPPARRVKVESRAKR